MAEASGLLYKTVAASTAERGRDLFLQWTPAPHVSICNLRSIPFGRLERLSDVPRLCFRVPLVGYAFGRPPIRAYHSLLCLAGPGAIPVCPHLNGLFGRILEPHASDDHRPNRHGEGAHMIRSRRRLIVSGIAAAAGASGLAAAARLAQKYGLIPPDHGGIYGPGETLTYATQRLLTRHSLAREFSRSQISPRPFPNELAPLTEDFKRLQARGFADWRLSIDGLVHQPAWFSIADLK